MAKSSVYQIWKSQYTKQWHFHFKGANGEIVAPSQGYSRKIDCKAAIELLRNSRESKIVEIK